MGTWLLGGHEAWAIARSMGNQGGHIEGSAWSCSASVTTIIKKARRMK